MCISSIWRLIALLSVTGLLLGAPSGSHAQEVPPSCGGQLQEPGAFGPFDYREEKYAYENTYKSNAARIKIVEEFHYTKKTEILISMRQGVPVGADLSYTLRAFPNHHRALVTLIKLGEKEKTDQPNGSRFSIDCWFTRATTFAPDDDLVRMLYAHYLSEGNKIPEAKKQLEFVSSHSEENPFTQNNIGLIYFDLKEYELALTHALRAQALGLNVDGLKAKLEGLGKWVEPTK